MKRTVLIKHLQRNGVVLKREVANHSIFINQKKWKKNNYTTTQRNTRIFCQ